MNPTIESKSMLSSFWMNANERMSLIQSDTPEPDRFAALLKKADVNAPTVPGEVVVKSGDTLVGIVQRLAVNRGETLSQSQAYSRAMALARNNGIDNPNLIRPGQKLSLAGLDPDAMQTDSGAASTIANLRTAASAQATSSAAAASVGPQSQESAQPTSSEVLSQRQVASTSTRTPARIGDLPHTPILTRTLDRAVAKGFIPAQERQAVYDKIMDMSKTYGFAPDDFARMTLMESDGMNPRASNNSCHGIIQFCDGPDRGAASAGFASNPKAILNRSVLQQLDLVAKYFDDTGLKKVPQVGLDDLYLTVLTPAARNESRTSVKLNVPGTQSEYLYTNNDRRLPITRQSIVQGLHQNAQERLGMEPAAYQQLVNRPNQAVMRTSTQVSKSGTQVLGQGVWLASNANTGNRNLSGKTLPPSLPGGQPLPSR
ncbi:MAG: hypothetical protein RL307_1147 [Pseudomonadota bacterium]